MQLLALTLLASVANAKAIGPQEHLQASSPPHAPSSAPHAPSSPPHPSSFLPHTSSIEYYAYPGHRPFHINPDPNAPPAWQCDLGGWVRAADLSPNTVVPGEARLVANGTECSDITGWGVGMRFKERAIIKTRKGGWSPTPTVGEGGMFYRDMFEDSFEQYDSPSGSWGHMGEHRVRPDPMLEVREAERTVFDITQDLPLDMENAWLGDGWLEIVQPFAVHVPNTNFPPLSDDQGMGHMGYDPYSPWSGTALQDMCEYYLLVSLVNGTVVDVPAGRAGFLPAPEPTSAEPQEAEPEAAWPKRIVFQPPPADQHMTGPYHSPIPDCDKGNLTEFAISVDYRSTDPINITLHVTLTRTGNSSQVPYAMYFIHSTRHNHTWARAQVDSDAQYDSLDRESGTGGMAPWMNGWTQSMLMAKLPEPQPLIRPFDIFPVRHVFDNKDADAAEIAFEVVLPIAYNDQITFQHTFASLRSTLGITLGTRFACAGTDWGGLPPPESAVEAGVRARNSEWMEHVAGPPESEFDEFRHTGQYLQGDVALHVRSSQPATEPRPVHYLDPAALAPVITLPHAAAEVIHAPLSADLRLETDPEAHWNRYGRRPCRTIFREGPGGYQGSPASCGGQNKHAAKVWAYAQAVAEGLPVWEREETFASWYSY